MRFRKIWLLLACSIGIQKSPIILSKPNFICWGILDSLYNLKFEVLQTRTTCFSETIFFINKQNFWKKIPHRNNYFSICSDGQMSDLEISPPPRNKRHSMTRNKIENQNLQTTSHDTKANHVNNNSSVKRQHSLNSSTHRFQMTKNLPEIKSVLFKKWGSRLYIQKFVWRTSIVSQNVFSFTAWQEFWILKLYPARYERVHILRSCGCPSEELLIPQTWSSL